MRSLSTLRSTAKNGRSRDNRKRRTTLASEETAPKIAAFLYLEEVIALQRCSRQHARRFGAPGAAVRSRVQPRSRAAFWAEACRVEADKKRALSRRTATNGGFFESCAGLLD